MKLRLLPVLLTVAITSVVLFGGWFVYRSVAMENPLSNIVKEIDGVKHMDINVNSDVVRISVRLDSNASMREIYQQIMTKGKSIIGKRKVELTVSNPTSKTLDKIWAGALFDVAEAMDTKHYSAIPQTLNKIAAAHEGVKVFTEMDDSNVYVTLTHGKDSKFIILPRTSQTVGVWSE